MMIDAGEKSNAKTPRVAAALGSVALGLYDLRIDPGHAPHEAVPAAPKDTAGYKCGKAHGEE